MRLLTLLNSVVVCPPRTADLVYLPTHDSCSCCQRAYCCRQTICTTSYSSFRFVFISSCTRRPDSWNELPFRYVTSCCCIAPNLFGSACLWRVVNYLTTCLLSVPQLPVVCLLSSYPVRSAFCVVTKVLEDFKAIHAEKWRSATEDSTVANAQLEPALEKFQVLVPACVS